MAVGLGTYEILRLINFKTVAAVHVSRRLLLNTNEHYNEKVKFAVYKQSN